MQNTFHKNHSLVCSVAERLEKGTVYLKAHVKASDPSILQTNREDTENVIGDFLEAIILAHANMPM